MGGRAATIAAEAAAADLFNFAAELVPVGDVTEAVVVDPPPPKPETPAAVVLPTVLLATEEGVGKGRRVRLALASTFGFGGVAAIPLKTAPEEEEAVVAVEAVLAAAAAETGLEVE